ncbi:hypothetical protein GCM10009706_18980 [Curtobacterium citreum]|nr:hypothetical protein GCM10009706_18980 [Curtobacterium citreum]
MRCVIGLQRDRPDEQEEDREQHDEHEQPDSDQPIPHNAFVPRLSFFTPQQAHEIFRKPVVVTSLPINLSSSRTEYEPWPTSKR